MARRLCVAAASLLLPVHQAASQQPAGLHALVIGNAAYAGLPPLPACASSAHVVAASLGRAGFATDEKLNASNGEMGSAMTALAAAGGIKVIYVCGYGIDFGGRAFLLPASAMLDRTSDALTQGLIATALVNAMAAGAGSALVLLDTVDAGKSGDKLNFAALAHAARPNVGIAAVASAAPPPAGATKLAAAFAAALASPAPEAAAVLAAIAQKLGSDALVVPPADRLPLAPAPAAPANPSPVTVQANAMPDEAHMTEADRRQIQSALLRLGYYDKTVDGVFGADTRAAIRRFQHEIGADMTGLITPAESSRLLGSGK
jgi:hypothetical protein